MARGNTTAKLAEPLKSVATSEVLSELQATIADNKVDMLVIGLPRNLEGQDTRQTAWTRQWAAKVRTRLEIPMYWQDEALTSKQANGSIDEHALAAAVILQDFLNSPEDIRIAV
jgi:putative Holliday junction resolvase